METITAIGYGVDASYDGTTLHVHPHNKAARVALAGKMTEPLIGDLPPEAEQEQWGGLSDERTRAAIGDATHEAKRKVDEHLADVELARTDIASLDWKDATRLTNGRLTITTTTGRVHVMHFRRKQQDEMSTLRDALT